MTTDVLLAAALAVAGVGGVLALAGWAVKRVRRRDRRRGVR